MRAVPHQPSLNPYPLALLAASLAAGILLARYAGALTLAISLLTCAAFSLLAALAFARRREGAATMLLLLAFAGAGATLFALEQERSAATNRLRRWYDEGRIASGEPAELTGAIER